MTEKEHNIPVRGYNTIDTLALAYGTLVKLGWTIEYADNNKLIAYTTQALSKWKDEITVTAADNELIIDFNMVHEEEEGVEGRHRNHLEEFTRTFDTVKDNATTTNLDEWGRQLATIIEAEETTKRREEIDGIMNFSKGNLYITFGIIAINVLMFVIMVANGVNFFAPKVGDVLKWGASLPQLDLSGEWWRAFTSMFLHFGIIHLLLNMYALFMVSASLEPMLGKHRYITAYICSGLIASLVSILWYKDEFVVSAGASGAVFGMYGVFLALLTTNLIPQQVRRPMLQSILIFVAYNVIYGLRPGSFVNNAAHLGGLGSGMLIGYFYYFSLKNPSEKKTLTYAYLIMAVTLVVLFTEFRNNKTIPLLMDYPTVEVVEEKNAAPTEIKAPDRRTLFQKKLDEFNELDKIGLAPDNDSMSSPDQLISRYYQQSFNAWDKAQEKAKEMKLIATTDNQKKYVDTLFQYIELRRKWTSLQIRYQYDKSKSVRKEITDLTRKIQKLFESQPELQ